MTKEIRMGRLIGILALAAALLACGTLASDAQTVYTANNFHLVAANTDNSTSLKAGAGTVYDVQVSGIGSAPAYLKFYDKATAPTCGTDAVKAQIMIPAAATAANGAANNATFTVGKKFNAGIGFCVVTGIADTDDTAPAAATFVINISWR